MTTLMQSKTRTGQHFSQAPISTRLQSTLTNQLALSTWYIYTGLQSGYMVDAYHMGVVLRVHAKNSSNDTLCFSNNSRKLPLVVWFVEF